MDKTILTAVGVAFFIVLILMLPTYFLWNWLMPQIFGLPELTLVKALGVVVLSSILFKNSGASKD